MSKPSTIGLTASGPGEASLLPPALTGEQRQKLLKSAGRLVGRHGWPAFAQAVAEVCQGGADCWRAHPQSAQLWQRRADELRKLY